MQCVLFWPRKKHPFDSTKYEKIYTFLQKNYPELRFHKPAGPVSNEALSTVQTADYIHSLRLSGFSKFRTAKIISSRELIIQISEMEDLGSMKTTIGLCLLYSKLLKPMQLAVQGTIDATILALHKGNLLFSEFKGALTENFIAQELIPIHKRKLYYWKSSGTAEIDFLLEHDHDIYPLEVKAGKNRRKKSLVAYNQKYSPKLLYRASLMNLKATGNFVNYPLYLASLIGKTV